MSELFTEVLRIVVPIALIGGVVLVNRLIGLKYPLGALSCIAVFCLFYFGIELISSYATDKESTPRPLDSIFDVAVPVLLAVITLWADVIASKLFPGRQRVMQTRRIFDNRTGR